MHRCSDHARWSCTEAVTMHSDHAEMQCPRTVIMRRDIICSDLGSSKVTMPAMHASVSTVHFQQRQPFRIQLSAWC
eukprot:35457-Pelagomonas_calceolata.AAC.1